MKTMAKFAVAAVVASLATETLAEEVECIRLG